MFARHNVVYITNNGKCLIIDSYTILTILSVSTSLHNEQYTYRYLYNIDYIVCYVP